MKLAVFLKAVLFVVLVNYSAAAQEILKVEADSIPVLEEWWRTDLEPVDMAGGISYLPNFKDGHGAIAISTATGDKTWMLRFPGDTANVFTWQQYGAYKIQTGDFNGDGITDYIDAQGWIYPGIQNGQPPSKETMVKYELGPSELRIIADVNNDGFDDVLIGGFMGGPYRPFSIKVLLGGSDLKQLQISDKPKVQPSQYYDEHIIGMYQAPDKSWRILAYWDNYSLNFQSKSGDAGFVLYSMNVKTEGDLLRIDLKELDRTTEHSNDGKKVYDPWDSKIYTSSHSNNAYLIAFKYDTQIQITYDLSKDKITFLHKFFRNIGRIIPSVNGDDNDDFLNSYNESIAIFPGGDKIDTIPIGRIQTCPFHSVSGAGDVNDDGIGDLAFIYLEGCFSVLLGQTPTGISDFPKQNFSLKTFKTNSSHFTISFTLLKESHATFSLFDMEGKLIKVLKEGMFDAGAQSFVLDSGDMPQGAYVLQFTADGQTATEKILIAR